MAEMMQPRLAAPATDTPRDLFDLLLAARDPETGEGFSPDQLRDQIATMILAGHETTAVTLFWSLVLLSGAPDEQQRVAEEARGVEITPDNAMAAMPHLVRTRAVVSEAMRLYPPAFAIAREAIGRIASVRIDIPRGTVLLIAPWVLHRHRACGAIRTRSIRRASCRTRRRSRASPICRSAPVHASASARSSRSPRRRWCWPC